METLELGSRLDDYLIVDVLGKGGFGITYQALDPSLQRHLAIKEYFPDQFAERWNGNIVARNGEENQKMFQWGLDRFLSEARTLARFQHPNVVEVTRYFEANGTAYLAMKFEEGKDLDRWLKDRKEPLTEPEITAFILPVLDGLQAIHEQGLIHRDVKPQNIMIRNDGTPVLIDFGSARPATREDNTAMTAVISPGYSPPEQYGIDDSTRQGPPTDIYAIAGVIYRMITGSGPPDALMRAAGRKMDPLAEASNSNLNPRLLAAVDAGLALDADARPQTAAAYRSLLTGEAASDAAYEATAHQPKKARGAPDDDATYVRPVPGESSGAPTSTSEGRSLGWLWGVLGTLVVAAGGVLTFAWLQDPEPPADASVSESAAVAGSAIAAQAFTIVATPADATVTVRDLPGGDTAYTEGMLLPAGDYPTVVSAEGYEAWEETLIHGTAPTRREVSLEPLRYAMTLELSPENAQVEITGAKGTNGEARPFDADYRAGMKLAPGSYQVTASAPGYATASNWLEIGQESTNHVIKLAATPKPVANPVAAPRRRQAGDEFRDSLGSGRGRGPTMVVIPAGNFQMGDQAGIGHADENPVHQVSITNLFALSKHEITFGDYARFAKATNAKLPANAYDDGNRPVIQVPWNMASKYAAWLSVRTGERYRLPTEAEWEYAARAGTTSRYPWGKEIACDKLHVSRCSSEWGSDLAPVGSFSPNAFGLYDMHGNVQEMVQDCYHPSYNGAPTDGSARERTDGYACDVRVGRGGSVNSQASQLRSARRGNVDPRRNPYNDVGFRVARDFKIN
ncbi:MAG: SUMF1/EgtB/PvdO family nonheme iron enzyme [Gammaproteobacteria bacterium]|nr:SUMF1/EgtB/PvdO family nonheme iron enzyme [Gammaproteobacteria bacterium]